MSLANLLTVVGDVAPVLSSFATRWVQTPHDYDSHVAATMPADWVDKHQPVISRHKEGHELYAKFSFGRPEGKLVLCHQRCGKEVTSRASGNIVNHKCLGCLSRCVTPKIKSDRGTTLGRKALVKVQYPPLQYPTEWKLNATSLLPTAGTLSRSRSASSMGSVSRSRSASGIGSSNYSISPTPPPPSSHEASPAPSDSRKRSPAGETNEATTQKRQRRKMK